jgi:hypothetical protein
MDAVDVLSLHGEFVTELERRLRDAYELFPIENLASISIQRIFRGWRVRARITDLS